MSDPVNSRKMDNLAFTVRKVISNEVERLKQIKYNIMYKITTLEVLLPPLNKQANHSLVHMKSIQYFLDNQSWQIAERVSQISYIYQYLYPILLHLKVMHVPSLSISGTNRDCRWNNNFEQKVIDLHSRIGTRLMYNRYQFISDTFHFTKYIFEEAIHCFCCHIQMMLCLCLLDNKRIMRCHTLIHFILPSETYRKIYTEQTGSRKSKFIFHFHLFGRYVYSLSQQLPKVILRNYMIWYPNGPKRKYLPNETLNTTH